MPARNTEYLSVTDIISIHDHIIVLTAAAYAPLRDEGLLESAIMRPRMAAYYEGADLVRQAAILTIGISQAQAFVDGNKRTAFGALEVFLDLNGFEYREVPIELARQLEAVAERSDDLDAATERFDTWLRERIAPRE